MFKQSISFRSMISEIPSTTHGAFALYRYPAKFIPQVVAYVLKNFHPKKNKSIFDPFAGYGTVGIVARLYGYNYELWDLNPLLQTIHNAILCDPSYFSPSYFIKEIQHSTEKYYPNWSRIMYWFPETFLPILTQAWGYTHSLPSEQKNLIFLPLIKITQYYSLADDKIHKLIKSNYSRKKITNLLQHDWKKNFFLTLENEIRKFITNLRSYNQLNPQDVKFIIEAGINSQKMRLEKKYGLLLTSPPYLQAQEYIRSTKLALYWLGFNDTDIKNLSKQEIPYNNVHPIKVHSNLFYSIKEKIESPLLLQMYERYFYSILNILEKTSRQIEDYLCIFLGPATIHSTPIPLDDIIVEHFQNCGWYHKITLIDTIKSRNIFKLEKNPSTGRKSKRIKTEHLVILKREDS
ncbi:hypothetical protein [Candidatus Hodarchaeum mangrovi]